MMLYRNGNFKLAFSKETETQLDKLRQEFMADDTEAGMIQAWLDEHEDRKVCSLMLFKEALDNPYVKPKKAETDRICEIMNTSIVGWKQGTMTRFKDYGTQRSWVCVNENCKRDAKDLKMKMTGIRLLRRKPGRWSYLSSKMPVRFTVVGVLFTLFLWILL